MEAIQPSSFQQATLQWKYPKKKKRTFDECLRSLDIDVPKDVYKDIPTYTEMFNTLPELTQKTIQLYYTERNAIASAVRGSYNTSIQNQKCGITEPSIPPMLKTLWKRPESVKPPTDFKKCAAGDES